MRGHPGPAILSLVIAFSGCTTTYYISLDPGPHRKDTLTCAQLHQKLQDRSVRIQLTDGTILPGEVDLVGTDSLYILNRGENRPIHINQVSRIVRVNHVEGAITGLSQGLFAGSFLGWSMGSLTSHGKDRGLGIGVSTVEGALLGLVAGGLYGAIHGSVQVYQFAAPAGASAFP